MNAVDYLAVIAFARDRADEATRAFAGVISSGYGTNRIIPPLEHALGWETFTELMNRYFPGALGTVVEFQGDEAGEEVWPALSKSEFPDLLSLLFEHMSFKDEKNLWLAHAVAVACLGGNHLWQDMGLLGRKALSSLLSIYFRSLYDKNVHDMKWKKFFYKQICEREGLNLCKAPNCEECCDYDDCFGPEEASDVILKGGAPQSQYV